MATQPTPVVLNAAGANLAAFYRMQVLEAV
jgi:hypothetical protein